MPSEPTAAALNSQEESPSIWARLNPFTSSRPQLKFNDEEEPLLANEGDGLGIIEVEKRSPRFSKTQIILFVVFQIACFALGAAFAKVLSANDVGQRSEPRVPPVWTLPPVRMPSYINRRRDDANLILSQLGIQEIQHI